MNPIKSTTTRKPNIPTRCVCVLPTLILTYILEWLGEFGELVKALFHYVRCPLVDFVVLVGIASYGCFY